MIVGLGIHAHGAPLSTLFNFFAICRETLDNYVVLVRESKGALIPGAYTRAPVPYTSETNNPCCTRRLTCRSEPPHSDPFSWIWSYAQCPFKLQQNYVRLPQRLSRPCFGNRASYNTGKNSPRADRCECWHNNNVTSYTAVFFKSDATRSFPSMNYQITASWQSAFTPTGQT